MQIEEREKKKKEIQASDLFSKSSALPWKNAEINNVDGMRRSE